MELDDFVTKVAEIMAYTGAGNKAEAAKATMELGLKLAPVDDLRRHLTDAAAARDQAIADEAERVKFGGDQ